MAEILSRIALWIVTFIELAMVGAVAAIVLLRAQPKQQSRAFVLLQSRLAKFARRKRTAAITVGFLALTIRAALIPLLGIPLPGGHDEFSFALAADTFVSGRLTNSTHPMWTHFETFHVIQKPTYMSMYPPANGLVLAAGRILGNAWFGQWITTSIMCAAICWMLQAWLPPTWAFFGGALAVLRLGILSYWMNTYWIGSIAALGGALVYGAYPRIRKYSRPRDALILAIGVAILANSRPYEGLVVSIPVLIGLIVWFFRSRQAMGMKIRRVVVPSALLLIAAGGGTAYYYSRVTGNPFRMTYQVNRATYAIAPYFLWERPYPEPQYRYAVMREFYEKELKEYEENRTLLGFIRRSASKLLSWWGFYLGPALTIPVLALPSALKDKRIRFAVVALSVFVFGLALETFMMPHYFAPATCLVYLLLMQAMRHLRLWRFRGDGRGLALVRAVPVICVGMIVLRLGAIAAHAQIEPAWPRGSLKRAGVISQLKQMHGDHLILVRYRPDHNLHDEYVYNGANIDSQRVIWARDSEGCDNQELFRYYHDRRIWLLEPDYWPLRLQPYPQQPPQLKCDSRP